MVDDTWQHWLFEHLADGTINWYVDEEFIGDGTTDDNNGIPLLSMGVGTAAATVCYYDNFKIWEPESTGWVLWPGKITTADADLYEYRVRFFGGTTRGQLTELDINIDVDDIVEYQNDIAIAAAGGTRLTLVKTFTAITNISGLAVQTSGAETAITAKAADKQATAGANNGPLIICYDSGGNSVAGHVDVRLKGY